MNLQANRLAQLPMFKGVPPRELDLFCRRLVGRSLVRGQTLYVEGNPARDACLLLSGRLSIRLGQDARVIAEGWPGEVIGEAGLFAPHSTRNATVQAMMDSEVAILSQDLLIDLAENRAVVALEQHLMGSMARRIRSANGRLEQAHRAPEASPSSPPKAAPARAEGRAGGQETLRAALLAILGGSS